MIEVVDNGVSENIISKIQKNIALRMEKLDDLYVWVIDAVDNNEDVNGQPFKPLKRGGKPLQGKGDLLDVDRFVVETVVITDESVSRTLIYNAPEYYQYVQIERPFILPGKLNPNVVQKVIEVLSEEV